MVHEIKDLTSEEIFLILEGLLLRLQYNIYEMELLKDIEKPTEEDFTYLEKLNLINTTIQSLTTKINTNLNLQKK